MVPPRTRSLVSSSGAEQAIKAFFGGNALVALLVLALITVFLFREGFGFFGQNLSNLRLYRAAGLEYVDIIRVEAEKHSELTRALNDLRLRQFQKMQIAGVAPEQANESLAVFDQFATAFSDTSEPLNGLVSDLSEQASALKEQLFAQGRRRGSVRRSSTGQSRCCSLCVARGHSAVRRSGSGGGDGSEPAAGHGTSSAGSEPAADL
jgi:phosphate transport system permease protein